MGAHLRFWSDETGAEWAVNPWQYSDAQGHEPTPEPLAADLAALPLALGADGGMVPLRPEGGNPRGKIRWREIKVGVRAR